MRFSAVLFAVVVVLVAGLAPARTMDRASVPEEVKAAPPWGTHWDEELGVFVFDEPIPIQEPRSNLLEYGTMLKYDNGLMYYTVIQQEDYFVATKFPVPNAATGIFELEALMVACFNDPGYLPEPGKLVVRRHDTSGECKSNPEGDVLGEVQLTQIFTGLPFIPDPDPQKLPVARWTIVGLSPTILMDAAEMSDFWIAWDYRPGFYEPGGYYNAGGFIQGIDPEDIDRFYETYFASDCPQYFSSGPWLIRALGNELTGKPKYVDIKTTSCPNPLAWGSIGDVQVAAVSAGYFDAAQVIPESFRMLVQEGGAGGAWMRDLYPYKMNTEPEDLSEMTYIVNGDCDCNQAGPDGLMDWSWRFEKDSVWVALFDMYGTIYDGEYYPVEFEWQMADGGWMTGRDCFRAQIPGNETGEIGPGGGDPLVGLTRDGLVGVFALHQNAPNPFRDATTISFSIPAGSHTNLTIHDVSGRTVATLVDDELSAGTHAVEWNASVPSGVYFCRLTAGGETAGARMVVAR